MIKIINECNELIFEHHVGSVLINTNTTYSDIDLFRVYKNDLFLIDLCDWDKSLVRDIASNYFSDSSLHYADYNKIGGNISTHKTDITSISILNLLNELTTKTDGNPALLSKLISHLYAVKYNLILEIKNQELYNYYIDWLQSPGIAGLFWYRAKKMLWATLSSLPDRNKNWSQEFDGSPEHIQMRKEWMSYDQVYPTVDKILGYDSVNFRRIAQTILVATCVLTDNKTITDQEKIYLKKLREKSLTFEEYKQLKIYIWKEFRKAVEDMYQTYYLGRGYSIEEAKQKNIYGITAFFNFLSKVSNTQRLSIDNNFNVIPSIDTGKIR
jgi:hypothetical protein